MSTYKHKDIYAYIHTYTYTYVHTCIHICILPRLKILPNNNCTLPFLPPSFLFPTIISISLICIIWPKSVVAHQIGSGMNGLGLGTVSLDWNAASSFVGNPLVTPLWVSVNIFFGYMIYM